MKPKVRLTTLLLVTNIKKTASKLSPKNQDPSNDAVSLKKDIENLKLEVSKKEDQIKQLNNKINTLLVDNKNLNNALIDSSEKFHEEIAKRNDDLEFFKKSYEEQKNRVNKEHELISSSLYELALQFMGLKNELQKKINPNVSYTRNNESLQK